ncbi:MAG: HD domain-containing phosphohydrolase [bacterium]
MKEKRQKKEEASARGRSQMENTFDNNDEFLTAKEAAKLLKVTVGTIKNYIYKGELKSFKTPGGQHRISKSDLFGVMGRRIKEIKREPHFKEIQKFSDEFHIDYVGVIRTFLEAIEIIDTYTQGHSARVAKYSLSIAKKIGLSPKEMRNIELSALLHDIGKIAVGSAILGKPGRLNEKESFIVRKHAVVGEGIVEQIEFLQATRPLIRHHHERYDGQGYPDGLSGEEIPLGARIISVAEAYDSITSGCPYRQALLSKEAVKELKGSAGSQFDPVIVKTFTEVLGA